MDDERAQGAEHPVGAGDERRRRGRRPDAWEREADGLAPHAGALERDVDVPGRRRERDRAGVAPGAAGVCVGPGDANLEAVDALAVDAERGDADADVLPLRRGCEADGDVVVLAAEHDGARGRRQRPGRDRLRGSTGTRGRAQVGEDGDGDDQAGEERELGAEAGAGDPAAVQPGEREHRDEQRRS